jgi:PAP2 superfamily C-terminal
MVGLPAPSASSSSSFGPFWRGIENWDEAGKKFLACLTIFVVGFALNDVASGAAMYRSRDLLDTPRTHPPQPDVGWDIVGAPSTAVCGAHVNSTLPTYVLLGFMLACLFRMMVFDIRGAYVWMRFAVLEGVLLLLRATTVWVTSLDNPWPGCDDCGQGSKKCPTTLWGCVSLTALGGFPFFDCGDSVFSGHTLQYILCGLIWTRFYRGPARNFLLVVVWACVGWGLWSLLSCRFHYTLDLIVAIYLAAALWWLWDVMDGLASSSNPSGVARFVRWVSWPSPRELAK